MGSRRREAGKKTAGIARRTKLAHFPTKKTILTQFGSPAFFIVLSVANWLPEFNQRARHALVSTAGVKKSKPESVFKIAFRQFSTRGGFLFLNLILVIVRGNGER